MNPITSERAARIFAMKISQEENSQEENSQELDVGLSSLTKESLMRHNQENKGIIILPLTERNLAKKNQEKKGPNPDISTLNVVVNTIPGNKKIQNNEDSYCNIM